MTTNGILIADDDLTARKQMAEQLMRDGYEVTVTNSVAGAIYGAVKKTAQVVLLSKSFDELAATELIPILKACNRHLKIILVASELPLALIRKARDEGIFYHALKTGEPEDNEELRQAVRCAFEQENKQN